MILTIAKNYGGTDEYSKYLGIASSIELTLFVYPSDTIIPEKELWKVFKFVHNTNKRGRLVLLTLRGIDVTTNYRIVGWDEKYCIQRILDALQACKAQIHLQFQ